MGVNNNLLTGRFTLKKASLLIFGFCVSALLGACGGGDDDDEVFFSAEYGIYATDAGANLNIYEDDGKSDIRLVKSIIPKNANGNPVTELGEIHYAHKMIFLVIRNGVEIDKNDDGNFENIGSGLVMINPQNDNSVGQIIPLVSDLTGKPSRAVHTFADPDGKHIWINNDGPSQDGADDSVFRVNWDHMDSDNFGSVKEILVGNGHKKSAFAHPHEAKEGTKRLFVTHNLTEQSVSIIDNDHMNHDTTMLTVQQTVDLAKDDVSNTPHGMAFSKVSGRIYTGITSGDDIAVSVIDTTGDLGAMTTHDILVGTGDKEIPAAGYMKASHDGKEVYTAGYVKHEGEGGHGYFSIIDAENDDAVKAVIDFGDVATSSFDIVSMEMDSGMKMKKVYFPSRVPFGPPNDTVKTNVVNILNMADIDLTTGKLKDGASIKSMEVGAGPAHRNGPTMNNRIYYPNGGDCGHDGAASGPGCKEIVVIDMMNDTAPVARFETLGDHPGNIAVFDIHVLRGHTDAPGGHTGPH